MSLEKSDANAIKWLFSNLVFVEHQIKPQDIPNLNAKYPVYAARDSTLKKTPWVLSINAETSFEEHNANVILDLIRMLLSEVSTKHQYDPSHGFFPLHIHDYTVSKTRLTYGLILPSIWTNYELTLLKELRLIVNEMTPNESFIQNITKAFLVEFEAMQATHSAKKPITHYHTEKVKRQELRRVLHALERDLTELRLTKETCSKLTSEISTKNKEIDDLRRVSNFLRKLGENSSEDSEAVLELLGLEKASRKRKVMSAWDDSMLGYRPKQPVIFCLSEQEIIATREHFMSHGFSWDDIVLHSSELIAIARAKKEIELLKEQTPLVLELQNNLEFLLEAIKTEQEHNSQTLTSYQDNPHLARLATRYIEVIKKPEYDGSPNTAFSDAKKTSNIARTTKDL